jgi:hypothetical protein
VGTEGETWKAEKTKGEGLGTPRNLSGLNSKQSSPQSLRETERGQRREQEGKGTHALVRPMV